MPRHHEGDLSSYPKQYLQCRGERYHPWRTETDKKVLRNSVGRIIEFTRAKVCILCGKKRTTKITVTKAGRFVPQEHQYEDPPGYSIRRTNPISQEAIRDALFLAELAEAIPTAELERLLSKRPSTKKPRAQRQHLRAV